MLKSSPKVYHDSYELLKITILRSKNFDKHFRPTLARKLEEAAIAVTIAIRHATTITATEASKSRLSLLQRASRRLNEMRVLLQLSHELKQLSPASYGQLSEMVELVGRQVGGIYKSANKQPPQEPKQAPKAATQAP